MRKIISISAADTSAEFFRQRIQRLFCNLDEIFASHPLSSRKKRGHAHPNSQAIIMVCVELFWAYSAHAQWYASHHFA